MHILKVISIAIFGAFILINVIKATQHVEEPGSSLPKYFLLLAEESANKFGIYNPKSGEERNCNEQFEAMSINRELR